MIYSSSQTLRQGCHMRMSYYDGIDVTTAKQALLYLVQHRRLHSAGQPTAQDASATRFFPGQAGSGEYVWLNWESFRRTGRSAQTHASVAGTAGLAVVPPIRSGRRTARSQRPEQGSPTLEPGCFRPDACPAVLSGGLCAALCSLAETSTRATGPLIIAIGDMGLTVFNSKDTKGRIVI